MQVVLKVLELIAEPETENPRPVAVNVMSVNLRH